MNSTIFLFIATLLCWGPTWYIIKFQLGTVDPMVSVFYRFFLASVIILLFCIYKKINLRFSIKEHFFIAVLGIFLFNINYVIFYLSTQYLISGFVALCFSSILFMNVINNIIFHRSSPNIVTLIGGTIGTLGLIIIFYDEIITFEFSSGTSYGIFLGIIATYFASLGNLISAHTSKIKLEVIPVTGLGMFYGSISLVIYLILMGNSFSFEVSHQYIFSLIYLSIFGSVFGFSLYLTLIKKLGSNDAAYVAIIMPLVALVVSTFFEGLVWDLSLVLGAIMIVLGNIIILKRS
ncbi:DMT family transporter [Alphaproteobacteria bacterium]|nr:DMT family transporter [Alphaproteobacteria bacterium]MDC0594636.1 DMT family transporter [Alphaproteobacteria bacterium]|tara:strand:+ start:593 stop:1465 length:873 start_codon:yes stop_codon:yes gene_type:complete